MFLYSTVAITSIVVVVLVIALVILFRVIGKIRSNNMQKNILQTIKDNLKNKNIEAYDLVCEKNRAYDIKLSTKSFVYYIKIIKNFSNDEICVNSKYKWQLRSSAFDNTLRLVSDIENLMNLEIQPDPRRLIRKIYLIYPSCSNLLKYINECEMIFIYPDTDVYGTNIITYKEIKDSPDVFFMGNDKTKPKEENKTK